MVDQVVAFFVIEINCEMLDCVSVFQQICLLFEHFLCFVFILDYFFYNLRFVSFVPYFVCPACSIPEFFRIPFLVSSYDNDFLPFSIHASTTVSLANSVGFLLAST